MLDRKSRWNLILFAVIVLLLIGSIVFLWMRTNVEVRSIVGEQYQTQQLILTQYISYSIEELLNEKVLLLEVSAENEKGVPEDLFVSKFKTIYEVADIYYVLEFLDVNGTVVSGYPENNVPYGYNLYTNNQTDAFEYVKDTKEVYISEPLKTVEGLFGAFVWVPVFEGEEFKGAILAIVSDENIIKQFETTANDTSYVYILDDKGTVLYDQSGRYQKGTDYFGYINADETERLAIVKAQINGLEGNGRYPSKNSHGHAEDTLVSYSPIMWYNQVWSVGFASPAHAVDQIIVSVYLKLFTVAAASVLFILFVSSEIYFLLINWNRSLEDEVKKKTNELQQSNSSLMAANEKLKELDKLKTEFVSIVSHELKTPLTAMKTSSEFLREDTCDPAVRKKMLDLIIRNIDRQARMVDDLLDISKIESNRMKFNMDNIELQEALDLSLETVHRLAGEKGIHIQVNIPDSIPGVCADKDKLIQVFVNLLNNAIKFTPKGGKISIMAEEVKEYVEVRVKDTGIGMDSGNLESIFDKFYQIDSTSTRKVGGSGLGLAITRGIIRGMGGSIWAESEPSKGSTFIFTLQKAYYSKKKEEQK